MCGDGTNTASGQRPAHGERKRGDSEAAERYGEEPGRRRQPTAARRGPAPRVGPETQHGAAERRRRDGASATSERRPVRRKAAPRAAVGRRRPMTATGGSVRAPPASSRRHGRLDGGQPEAGTEDGESEQGCERAGRRAYIYNCIKCSAIVCCDVARAGGWAIILV